MSDSTLAYFDPETLADPYPWYEHAQAAGAVIAVPEGARETWLVRTAGAIRQVLAAPQLFSSRPNGVAGLNFYPPAEQHLKERGFGRVPHIITMDAPRHTAYRKVLSKLLLAKKYHLMRPGIRRVAHGLIDGFEDGRCEFVHDFAWKLSILVVSDLVGVDTDRIEDFKRWADAWVRPLLKPLTEEEMIECMEGVAQLQHYLVSEIGRRKHSPREDLLTDIAQATIDLGQGEVPLRQHEQLGLLEALIIAGNDSTANAIALGMLRLVEMPELAQRLRSEPKLIERFAEESLRYESAVQNNFRTVTEDTVLEGETLHKGATVLLCWGAANRDPEVFPDPLHFDLARPNLRSHFAFGGGAHMCAGASLARQELVESFDVLLQRLRNIRLAGGVTPADIRRAGGVVTHGLQSLPLRFEASPQ